LIRDAEVVVADVTRSNPQVMYEIGVAHGYRKPTVLLRDATADTMIFDIASHMVLVYEPNNLRDLGPRLAKTLYRL
jgi:nucleoside 2-deoxyribosyltransferase